MGPGMIYVTTKTDESIKVSTFKVKLLTNIDTWYLGKDHQKKVYNYFFFFFFLLFKRALQFGILRTFFTLVSSFTYPLFFRFFFLTKPGYFYSFFTIILETQINIIKSSLWLIKSTSNSLSPRKKGC